VICNHFVQAQIGTITPFRHPAWYWGHWGWEWGKHDARMGASTASGAFRLSYYMCEVRTKKDRRREGGGAELKCSMLAVWALLSLIFFSTQVPLQQIGAVYSWIFVYFRISNGINKQNFLKKAQ